MVINVDTAVFWVFLDGTLAAHTLAMMTDADRVDAEVVAVSLARCKALGEKSWKGYISVLDATLDKELGLLTEGWE